MLYVNGCSYTFGVGIAERNIPGGDEEIVRQRYSTLLAGRLGMDVINQGWPGSCNKRIFRHALTEIIASPEIKLAIICWSDPNRTEIFRPQETVRSSHETSQITPQGVNSITSYFHREALEGYFGFLNSEETAVMDTLSYMLALDQICSLKKLPIIQCHYKDNFNQMIAKVREGGKNPSHPCFQSVEKRVNRMVAEFQGDHVWQINEGNTDWSFTSYMKDKEMTWSTISGGHPDASGHKIWADYLYDYVVEHNVVN